MRVRVNSAKAGIMLRYTISLLAGTYLSATKLPFLELRIADLVAIRFTPAVIAPRT